MTASRPLRAVSAALAAAAALLLLWPGDAGTALPGAVDLALAGVRSALVLGSLALAGALLLPGRLAQSLGLARSPDERRLPELTLVLGMLGLSQLLDLALEASGALEGSRLEAIDSLLGGARDGEIVLSVLGLVLAPAAAEELLFRGLLLRGLRARLGAPAALLLSALLFGASHLELVHGAAAAILGLYLGALTLVTGRIRAAFLCHAANNAAALASALLGPLLPGTGWPAAAAHGLLAACLAALVLSLWRIGRAFPLQGARGTDEGTGEPPWEAPDHAPGPGDPAARRR